MNELGHYATALAWLLSLFGMIGGGYAGVKRSTSWFSSAAYATVFVFVALCVSMFCLAYAFVTDDYTNQYVWQFSNKAMPVVYKVTAIWGGMDGSMLLWCFMLSISSAIIAARSRLYPRLLAPWLISVVNSSTLFFLTIVVYLTNPFRYLHSPLVPQDGNGLNPLLQNEYMAIHPPMLYAGFTVFAIPYAFCLAALFSKQLSNEWLRLTRRWTIVAWTFLTIGIVLGGHWAYIELGWGGFWAWDPVENASFLPWLTGTAFLHSVMVQERKNMLRFWNIWLVVSTYALTVFGTFLTRSGVVQSVHAFASTDIGWVFLLYLGIILVVTGALTYVNRAELKSERSIESIFSREAAFLVNNLVFLSICFATLWGVMFPVLSEAVTGQKQTVGIPFFNAVNIPLFLLLIFLMGVGPLIAWRRASWSSVRRTFFWPFVIGLLSAVVLVWAGITEFYPVLSYALCVFVTGTIMGEFHRGLKAQRGASGEKGIAESVTTLVRRHRSRYGGHLVHFGVVVAVIGITASMAHKVEKEFSLKKGETYEIGRFSLRLDDLTSGRNENYNALHAVVNVNSRKDGSYITTLQPELRNYIKHGRPAETTTEVALKMSLREDLYIILAGLDNDGERAAFKLFINPLQVWLWFGIMIIVAGAVVVLLPSRRRVEVSIPRGSEELARR